MKKFTFKTEKPKGKWSSFYPTQNHIKLDKMKVGSIDDNDPYKIRLMVIKDDLMEDKTPNCQWKWIELKKKSKTLQEAKDFLNENIDLILMTYKLFKIE